MEELYKHIHQLLPQVQDEVFLQKLAQELEKLQSTDSVDIFSAYKTLQDENQQLKAQKDKFFSIVSTEMGTPLNSLKSMADFLMMDAEYIENPMLQESIRFLLAQVERIQQQMTNLIEWSNFEVKNYVFKAESFDIQEIIEKNIQLFAKSASQKTVHLQQISTESCQVLADKRMIGIIIYNLISNAVKFCRKNDRIEISYQVIENQVEIIVKDTGIGIGKAKMENLFNVARKATQRGTANEIGYGLGLITIQKILDLHQSTLSIQSEQGKGSTFSFRLALAK
jgi:signal transduction histidine kinase